MDKGARNIVEDVTLMGGRLFVSYEKSALISTQS
jgi:hypothetical protein